MKMRRRGLTLVGSVLLVIMLAAPIVLPGCAPSGEADEAPPAGEEVFTARMAYHWPPDNTGAVNSRAWAAMVEEATDGRIMVELYESASLYKAAEVPMAVREGAIEVGGSNGQGLSSLVPEAAVTLLPMACRTLEDAKGFVEAANVEQLIEERIGAKIVGYAPTNDAAECNNKGPIKALSDYEGIKMRTTLASWKPWCDALGIKSVAMSAGEVSSALGTGMVDGVMSTYAAFRGWNWYKDAPYISTRNIYFCQGWIYASLDWWNTLPKDLQDILSDIRYENEEYVADKAAEDRQMLLDFFEGDGCTLYAMEQSEFDKMKEASVPAWYEAAEHVGGTDILDKLCEYHGYEPPTQ